MNGWFCFCGVALMLGGVGALAQPATGPVRAGRHHDEGPDDRYAAPYTPITYGHVTTAPLPGLAQGYELADWDGDGRVDVLALLRRGGGLVLHRNVPASGGDAEGPRFIEPRLSPRLMDTATVGGDFRWFTLADLTGRMRGPGGPGGPGVLTYVDMSEDAGAGSGAGASGKGLTLFVNDGEPLEPRWRSVAVRDERGEAFSFGGRIAAGDLTGDGRDDLVIATFDEAEATDLPVRGRRRLSNFPPPDRVDPHVGRVWVARNITPDPDRPTLADPVELTADGRPLRVFMLAYPTVADLDGDGKNELILGAQDATLRVFRLPPSPPNGAAERSMDLTELGPLSDERGEPIHTALAVRVKPADFGEGLELVSSGYFGNNDRYVRYRRDPGFDGPPHHGWREVGDLLIETRPDTPVYGMGNSTVDVADLTGDGVHDLVLGAEPGLATWVRNVGSDAEPRYEGPFRLLTPEGERIETFSIVTSPGVGSYWGPFEWYSDRLAPRAVDWDGDGTLDLVSGSMGRRLYLFRGSMNHGEPRFARPELFRINGEELVLPDRLFPGVVDFNGDGHPDLILSNDAGHILLYPGDGTLDLGEPTRLGEMVLHDYWGRDKGNRSGFTVAPWTGPGRRDMIVYQFHRGIFLFADLGDGRYGPEQLLVPLYSHLAGPTVLDYDGDGTLDLVIGGDERRMIEPAVPAHLAVFRGQETAAPPTR